MSNNKYNGLQLVMERNAFYRDAYRRVVFVLGLLFLLNAGLFGVILYNYLNPPKPQYFATTADGRVITINPLTDPAVTDSFVLQWTSRSIQRVFSQDYVHWRAQLQDASVNFTTGGWKYFLEAMKASKNLNTLTDMKMVSDVQLTAAPQVISKGIIDGHYTWKIQMPLLIRYTNASQTINMPYNVTVIVVRMPVQYYPQRIAINNFLPEATDSGV